MQELTSTNLDFGRKYLSQGIHKFLSKHMTRHIHTHIYCTLSISSAAGSLLRNYITSNYIKVSRILGFYNTIKIKMNYHQKREGWHFLPTTLVNKY